MIPVILPPNLRAGILLIVFHLLLCFHSSSSPRSNYYTEFCVYLTNYFKNSFITTNYVTQVHLLLSFIKTMYLLYDHQFSTLHSRDWQSVIWGSNLTCESNVTFYIIRKKKTLQNFQYALLSETELPIINYQKLVIWRLS